MVADFAYNHKNLTAAFSDVFADVFPEARTALPHVPPADIINKLAHSRNSLSNAPTWREYNLPDNENQALPDLLAEPPKTSIGFLSNPDQTWENTGLPEDVDR